MHSVFEQPMDRILTAYRAVKEQFISLCWQTPSQQKNMHCFLSLKYIWHASNILQWGEIKHIFFSLDGANTIWKTKIEKPKVKYQDCVHLFLKCAHKFPVMIFIFTKITKRLNILWTHVAARFGQLEHHQISISPVSVMKSHEHFCSGLSNQQNHLLYI